MSACDSLTDGSLPLTLERQIDAVCERFEAAWKAAARGRRPAWNDGAAAGRIVTAPRCRHLSSLLGNAAPRAAECVILRDRAGGRVAQRGREGAAAVPRAASSASVSSEETRSTVPPSSATA